VSYDKMTVEEFGRYLIESEDLDPVYVALRNTDWDDDTMIRWLLAYWCFYDAGVACYIADAETIDGYWARFEIAAENEITTPFGTRWRRASERRHARGKSARKMVDYFRSNYPDPIMLLREMQELEGRPVAEVLKWAKRHYLFGDWIAFKVADMMEQVLGLNIEFDEAAIFMFDSPAKGASIIADQKGMVFKDQATTNEWAIDFLIRTFSDLTAPNGLRPIGLQEAETVLCKYKSHLSGHYGKLNDIIEIREHLQPWILETALAVDFSRAFPKGTVRV
jgi:hypothetical protein